MTFDPAKHDTLKWCTGRKWHIPMTSNRKKSRRLIWLTKWDKVKAHDTLIDWYTGREWPLKCMTVISAWWRSNMPFQRLSGRLSERLNYYITRWGREVCELEKYELETRCGRESHTRLKGPSGPPVSWRSDELETRCGRESQQKAEPPSLRLSSPGERERHNADGQYEWGGQYIAVFVQSPNPNHTQTLQIKWEIYFSKEVFARPLSLCRRDSFCMYMHVYM